MYTEYRTINIKTSIKNHNIITNRQRKTHRRNTILQRIIALCMVFTATFCGVMIGANQIGSAAEADITCRPMVSNITKMIFDNKRHEIAPIDKMINTTPIPSEELEVAEPEAEMVNDAVVDSEAIEVNAMVQKIYDVDMPANLQKHLYELTEQYPRLTVELLLSQIWRESSYRNIKSNPNSNGTVDHGYAQINTCNLQWVEASAGVTDIMDPIQNLNAQAFILNDIIEKYHPENWHILLMIYNMGPGNAQRCFDEGKYSSKYSRDIVNYAESTFGVTEFSFTY